MKPSFLLILLVNFATLSQTNAQPDPTDSLKKVFDAASSDTARLSILYNDNFVPHLSHPDQAIELYKQGSEIAQKWNDKPKNILMLRNISRMYQYGKSDDGTAFQWLQKALIVAEDIKDYEQLTTIYLGIGIIHTNQGNRDERDKAFAKVEAYAEKIPNLKVAPLSTPIIVYSTTRIDEALRLAKKNIALSEKAHIPPVELLSAYNILLNIIKKIPDRKQEADYYNDLSLNLIKKIDFDAISDPNKLMIAAGICKDLHQDDLAIKIGSQTLNLKGKDPLTMNAKYVTHEHLTVVYEAQKNYPLSLI